MEEEERNSIYALRKADNYALHTISQTFPCHCLWNSSTVYLKKRKEQGGEEVGKGKLEDKKRQKEENLGSLEGDKR